MSLNQMNSWLKLFTSKRSMPFYAGLMTFSLNIISVQISDIGDFATIWLGNASLMIMLLRSERQQGYYILLMGLLGNILGSLYLGSAVVLSIGLGVANTLEIVPALIFVRMQRYGDITLDDFDSDLLRLALSVFVGCMLSAIIGGIFMSHYSNIGLRQIILSWFAADMMAMLTILPFGLTITATNIHNFFRQRQLYEFLVILSVTIVVMYVTHVYGYGRFVVMMMPLLVASFRLNLFGIALVNMILSIVFAILVRVLASESYDVLSLVNNAYFLMAVTLMPPLIVGMLINKRNYYENRIRLSEERFRSAMEYSAIGMSILSLDGKWLEINKALCDIVGYSEDELKKLTFKDITYPPDLKIDLELLAELMSGKRKSYTLEKRYVHKDGRLVWILLVASAAYDEDGKPTYFIAQIEDINEKKLIEQSLKESEQRWKYALEGGGQGVWDWNVVTNSVYFSHTWKSMLGYKDDEIKNDLDEWSMRVHPDDKERIMRLMEDHMNGNTDEYVSEHRLKCKNGSYKWILDRGKVVSRDAEGKPLRIIGTHTDIDSTKNAEMEMQKLSQRMSLAIKAGKIGIFELDLVTNELVWDDSMFDLYGVDRKSFNCDISTWRSRVHPDDYEKAHGEYIDAVNDIRPFDTEFRIITPVGEIRYVRANAVVIRDVNNKPVTMLGTNWDITIERELSSDLFREKEKLRVTLQSIGDAVIVTDASGKIDFINPRASRLMGCTFEYAKGKTFNDICRLISESSGDPIENPILTCIRDQVIFFQDDESLLVNLNNEKFYIQSTAAPIHSASGIVVGAVMVMHDVTINRGLKIELQHIATHDPLTGLMNRREFETILINYLESPKYAEKQHALFYIDLDRFKIVNDSAGHAAGDELLKQICAHLRASIRDKDILARIGGDEFAIILPDCNEKNATVVASKIIQAIRSYRFSWENHIYDVGVSIGIATFNSLTINTETLMRHADIACYHAKNNGGNAYSIYDSADDEHTRHHDEIQMLAAIKESIEKKRLMLYAHEIRPIDVSGKHQPYYEILLRWIDSHGNVMSPSHFISVAERHNQMAMIDEWVTNRVLLDYGPRIAAIPGLCVSVNLSAKSINIKTFLNKLENMIKTTSIPKNRIGFELTETAVINHLANAGEFFHFIENEGCFVALDDFGVGLSSFNYLKHFPAKYVKIDGSFIRRLSESSIDKAIVESINELVHRLGGYTIAEYVESREIMDVVDSIGVDYVQGHYIGKARPLDDLLIELEANKRG